MTTDRVGNLTSCSPTPYIMGPAVSKSSGAPSYAERYRLIARTAHHLSARRGFEPGHELEDWLAAEQEVNSAFGLAGPTENC